MDKPRSKHFNFALMLALFFAFFALVWFGLEKLEVNNKSLGANQEVNAQDREFAAKFNFENIKPQTNNDPVLGAQSVWKKDSQMLTVNSKQVIYRNEAVKYENVSDSKALQDRAQEFLVNQKLNSGVMLDYTKTKALQTVDGHLEEVDNVDDAQVLEVVFTDIETGEDKVHVLVTGSEEILEVLISRGGL